MLRALTVLAALTLACSAAPSAGDASLADDRPAPDASLDAPSTGRCPGGVAPPYPAAVAVEFGAPLPDLALPSSAGPLRLSRYFTPCVEAPRLLVVRVLAAWSGPSRHHAAYTARLLELSDAARVDLVDVLVSAADNLPPDDDDLADWRARYDRAPAALARSDAATWRALSLGAQRLPLVAMVDPRTMVPVQVLDAPDTHDLAFELADALARLDGRARPRRPTAERRDGISLDAWEMVQAMALPARQPPDPTNAFADDPRAAALGRALFTDRRLSSSGAVSCGHCHVAGRSFTDGRAQSLGLAPGDRNAPSIVGAAGQRWQFWDGRADSAWSQALGPIEDPREMGFTRLGVAHAVADRYAAEYTAVYGALPPLDDGARFPAAGRPGDAAWEAMRPDDRQAVDRVFVNVGKSLAAFERTVAPTETAFDRYARGDVGALSAEAREGLRTFFEAGCAQCHHGPTLSDDSFHDVQFDTGRTDGMPDPGRFAGVDALRMSAFRADGTFSDAPTTRAHLRRLAAVEAMRGQFHTPTLRGVARTGPWGHGGTFTDLRAVVLHYAEAHDRRGELRTVGELDPTIAPFHRIESVLAGLVALLDAMSGP